MFEANEMENKQYGAKYRLMRICSASLQELPQFSQGVIRPEVIGTDKRTMHTAQPLK